MQYKVVYQKGKVNQEDYLYRHVAHLSMLPQDQQEKAEEMN